MVHLKRYSKKFTALEKEFMDMALNPNKLTQLWEILDANGNGIVSLAELDRVIVFKYPQLNNKKALMRAFKQTVVYEGNGDEYIQSDELPQLLVNLFYFNKLYAAFIDIDQDFDKRLDLREFLRGAKTLGLKMKKKQLKREFEEMDANSGGIVLFDEFCAWYTKKINPERLIATCTTKFADKFPRKYTDISKL
jgi:Ca2+-binding EF-hand superfamily protein